MAASWPLNSAKSCVPDSPEAWTCLDELNRSDSETPRHIREWLNPSRHSERRSASGPSSCSACVLAWNGPGRGNGVDRTRNCPGGQERDVPATKPAAPAAKPEASQDRRREERRGQGRAGQERGGRQERARKGVPWKPRLRPFPRRSRKSWRRPRSPWPKPSLPPRTPDWSIPRSIRRRSSTS